MKRPEFFQVIAAFLPLGALAMVRKHEPVRRVIQTKPIVWRHTQTARGERLVFDHELGDSSCPICAEAEQPIIP